MDYSTKRSKEIGPYVHTKGFIVDGCLVEDYSHMDITIFGILSLIMLVGLPMALIASWGLV